MIGLSFLGVITLAFGSYMVWNAATTGASRFGVCLSVIGVLMALAAVVEMIAGWMV